MAVLQIATGSWLSVTVTVKAHVWLFKDASEAVQVTVVIPLFRVTPLNVVPVPVVRPVRTYVSEVTPQISVAVAFHVSSPWV